MNEPNHPQEQADTQASGRMSSRATNFLKMAANNTQALQTGPLDSPLEQEQPDYQGYQEPDADQTQEQPGYDPAYQAEPTPPTQPQYPSQKPQTGVISATRYPAQRAGNTPPVEESDLGQGTEAHNSPPRNPTQRLSPEEQQELKEARIERMADRIANVLEKISMIRTDMLKPDRIDNLSKNSPAFAKFMAILLTQLEPVLLLVQRINQKMVERNLVKPKPGSIDSQEAESEETVAAPPDPVSFLELAEKNIIFCDNRKKPLYTLEQMRGKHGYTVSEEVIAPLILEEIIKAFHEVAPKAKAIPTPTSGIYANIPMDQVMNHIEEEEVMRFLSYVQRFPRGYVGKSFRITESFAGWVVSGTPDD